MNATETEAPDRATVLELLASWINQRPGLDFANYGDVAAYRSESRRITRQRDDALILLGAVARSSMTAECLLGGFRAYSGRLQVESDGRGGWRLDYCTGQYWPTEYRAAACAVLASALWDYHRAGSMPAPLYRLGDERGIFQTVAEAEAARGELHARTGIVASVTEAYRLPGGRWGSAGDCIRAIFRREFGATMQRRWFD